MNKDIKDIIDVIEICSIEIKELIAQGDTAKSTHQNSTGDTQLKLDIQSDIIIQRQLQKLKCIKSIVSEEQDEIIRLNDDAPYHIAYDPLDGSSLVDVNLSVGSIYGIYRHSYSGKNIIGAVYVVFGPRVEMVVAIDKAVKLYRLLDDKFVYIQDIKLQDRGNILAPGSTQGMWYPHHKDMIDGLFADGYRLRYSGGMVPDLHQILLKGGGLFSYPATKDLPSGKLRQLFEVFPFALVFKFAGGDAIDGEHKLLDINTSHIHDTTPCFFGSKYEVDIAYRVWSRG